MGAHGYIAIRLLVVLHLKAMLNLIYSGLLIENTWCPTAKGQIKS
jgi:hypothetical protein